MSSSVAPSFIKESRVSLNFSLWPGVLAVMLTVVEKRIVMADSRSEIRAELHSLVARVERNTSPRRLKTPTTQSWAIHCLSHMREGWQLQFPLPPLH